MKRHIARGARSQAGFTLVELLLASAIGLIVMTALTSVLLTSWRGWTVALGRVNASSQIRSFESYARDDFAESAVPATSGCGTAAANPCTTQPIVLTGTRAPNVPNPSLNYNFQVTYVWDSANGFVDRTAGGGSPVHAATEVTTFAWYVQGTAPHQTVVITLTVAEQGYSETQTLEFHPRLG